MDSARKEELIAEEIALTKKRLTDFQSGSYSDMRTSKLNNYHECFEDFVRDTFRAQQPTIERWGGWDIRSSFEVSGMDNGAFHSAIAEIHRVAVNSKVEALLGGKDHGQSPRVVEILSYYARPHHYIDLSYLSGTELSDFRLSVEGGVVTPGMAKINHLYRANYSDEFLRFRPSITDIFDEEWLVDFIRRHHRDYVEEQDGLHDPPKQSMEKHEGVKFTRALSRAVKDRYSKSKGYYDKYDKFYHNAFLSGLGDLSVKMKSKLMYEGRASVRPSDFIMLGHMMPGREASCYRFGGEYGAAKYLIATTPGMFTIRMSNGDYDLDETHLSSARAWGYIREGNTDLVLTSNGYFDGMNKQSGQSYLREAVKSLFFDGDPVNVSEISYVDECDYVYQNGDAQVWHSTSTLPTPVDLREAAGVNWEPDADVTYPGVEMGEYMDRRSCSQCGESHEDELMCCNDCGETHCYECSVHCECCDSYMCGECYENHDVTSCHDCSDICSCAREDYRSRWDEVDGVYRCESCHDDVLIDREREEKEREEEAEREMRELEEEESESEEEEVPF